MSNNDNLQRKLDSAERYIAEAVQEFAINAGLPHVAREDKVKAIVERIVVEEHCIVWNTTSERIAHKLDLSLVNDALTIQGAEIERLNAEIEELLEMVHHMFIQACSDTDRETGKVLYNSMCLSTYEHAQYYLIRAGKIKPEECVYE